MTPQELAKRLRDLYAFPCYPHDAALLQAADMLEADAQQYERLKLINSELVTAHNAMNIAGARLDDEIRALKKELSDLKAQQVAVPPGYQLVPIEPTPEMVRAGDDYSERMAYIPNGVRRWSELYQAMLAAAPQPPQTALVPMTDGQISGYWRAYQIGQRSADHSAQEVFTQVIRAIEVHHGIGTKP